MTYSVLHRYGGSTHAPGIDSFPALLEELNDRLDDEEHGSVAVKHESEWCIDVNLSRNVGFENVEADGESRHMKNVPEEKILELWQLLATGDLASLEREPWLPGYP